MAEKPYFTIEEISATLEEPKQIDENQKPHLTIGEIFTKLEEAKQMPQTGCPKIQKVAPYLRGRENFTKHYSPKFVSMGPIHHGQKNLKLGEQYKLMWTANYLDCTKQTPETPEDLYNKIADNIEELKDLFTKDAIEGFTNNEELSAMLFVDGCSLLEILDKASYRNLDELLNIKLDQLALMMQDLLLLENQLPYKVLKLLSSDENDANLIESMNKFLAFHPLFEVDKQEDDAKESNQQQEHKPANLLVQAAHHLHRLCRNILRRSDPLAVDKEGDVAEVNNQQQEPPVHLLDLMRTIVLQGYIPLKPKDQDPTKENAQQQEQILVIEPLDPTKESVQQQEHKPANLLVQAAHHIQCLLRTILCQSASDGYEHIVTYRNIRELKAAGIRVKTSKSRKLRDISFCGGWIGGELKLPQLAVDDIAIPTFLNLIAYEMCPDFRNDYGICSFVTFLDSLIDYPDDVKELRRARVLINWLGSDEEVAKLFNTISTDLVPDFDVLPYSDVRQEIEKHYRSKWMTWLTLGCHTYFSNPWSIIALIAALILLVLTVIQTVFAVLSYL